LISEGEYGVEMGIFLFGNAGFLFGPPWSRNDWFLVDITWQSITNNLCKKKIVGTRLPCNIYQEPIITALRHIHYATTEDQTENQHFQKGISPFRHHTPFREHNTLI